MRFRCSPSFESPSGGKRALKPLDLIDTSRKLLQAKNGRPTQANLRRATSSAYYAVFHCLAKTCADLFVGGQNSSRSKHAWRQVYRALEHGMTKNACKNQAMIKKFPKEVEDFANTFVKLQGKRHLADYDPTLKFYKSDVEQDIDEANDVIGRFCKVDSKDRRAFSAYVLLKTR